MKSFSRWWIAVAVVVVAGAGCRRTSNQTPKPKPGARTPSAAQKLVQKKADEDFQTRTEQAPKGYVQSKEGKWLSLNHGNRQPGRVVGRKGRPGGDFGRGGLMAKREAVSGGSSALGIRGYGSGGGGAFTGSASPAAKPAPARRYRRRGRRRSRRSRRRVRRRPSAPAKIAADPASPKDKAGAASNVPIAQNNPLKASETDDNQNFDQYLQYFHQNKERVPKAYQMDVSERYVFRVVDRKGRGLPNCRIVVSSKNDAVLWQGRTGAQGRMLFFPRVSAKHDGVKTFLVSFLYRGTSLVKTFQRTKTGRLQPWKVTLPVTKELPKVRLEVLFVLDTTGSMSDEIARVQQTLLAITKKIRGMKMQPEIRYGMVLYRDRTDAYITRRYPFTSDVEEFDKALRQVSANGGGDMPEAMNMGLYAAVHQMKWSPNALRLAFLVADAPPHLDYKDDVPYTQTLRDAVKKGIKIFPTAASGLNAQGTFVMRQIAQFTGARFLFIEYGSGTATSHGVTTPQQSNNLDDLILRIVQEELSAYVK